MSGSDLVDIEDARRRVRDAVTPLPRETVALDAALGRVLAENVVAGEPVPAFDNSAMDGFAVRGDDLAGASPEHPLRLPVVGESRAGAPAAATLSMGAAIAISTGAVVPDGADAVVPIEATRARDGRVEFTNAPTPGQHVRRAGEDIGAGQTVLRRGTFLGPVELGVLASLARAGVPCARRPRVAVVVSGDELLDPSEPMRPGGVRDSSWFSIPALARTSGGQVLDTTRVRDDIRATREAIADAAPRVDVLVVCGGVSVGEHDHVRSALQDLGAHEVFWGLALKPGRPAWFGKLGDTLVFGLPGNPVSAIVTFTLLVVPAVRALAGVAEQDVHLTAVLDVDYAKAPGRAHAVRCRLTSREDGWHAQPTGPQGSHILTSMLGADALAIVPSEVEEVRAGERVRIEPLLAWRGART